MYKLTEQVKRKLDITWSDEITDSRVEDIIESAIPTMINKLGIADSNFDFSKPGQENILFINYCLYERNHCVEEFDLKYANDIAQCRQKHTIEQLKNEVSE